MPYRRALVTVAGALREAASTDYVNPVTQLTYRPGGVAAPGVVTDWAGVDAFNATQTEAWTLIVDTSLGTAEVPAGVVTDFGGRCVIQKFSSANPFIVRDTAIIKNPREIQYGIITCEAITSHGVEADIDGALFIVRNGGGINNVFGTSLVAFLRMSSTNGNVLASFEAGLFPDDAGSGQTIEYTSATAFNILAAIVNSGGQTFIPANTVTAPAGSTFFALHDSTDRLTAQSGIAGTVIYSSIANSNYLAWANGPTANRPAYAGTGHMYFDTDLVEPVWFDGASWITVGGGGGGAEHSPGAAFGDGSNAASIAAGQTVYVRVPYSGTISRWDIVADISCTCVVDVWKAAGSIPTNADSITAATTPALTAATVATDSTLTGWTTTVTAGDVLAFALETLSGTPSQITISLLVT